MSEKTLNIRKATKDDISLVQNLIKGLAAYEKRPQDMTGTQEQLMYWIFERSRFWQVFSYKDCGNGARGRLYGDGMELPGLEPTVD